ncbi:hypothetical protein PPTG_17858 [Phytophthora nicotianae INRA-310]|uniref:CCHC-type domain-containing protein n=1 Tax=Phytophthora nicotianae (strain INRA-310) TaxID=761204 RepID=W2PI02_PHYN3|nr:hypothetical protein PPTG_17858 [Phytophthora nicotianae INRA-310]ETN00653.1 hypothetical protein PPTG_17858 [Phytophthora nicotianae INRA-310]
MAGTTGQTMVIPGIGGTGLPAGMVGVSQMTTTDGEAGAVALFTNAQGVWYDYSGTWDVPLGRSQERGNPKGSERKVRDQRDTDDSGEESDPGHWSAACPNEPRCYACKKSGHFARDCPDAEAKTRNDERMRQRQKMTKPAEN